ncbi:MAG: sugar phosphate isomerase/epimerase family protein [Sphingomonadaceae bacterium]
MRIEQVGANTSCLAGHSLEEAVNVIRQLGFHGLTLLGFAGARHSYGELAGFWFRELSGAQRAELRRVVSGFEKLTIHAPFADLPLFTYDPRLARLSLDRVKESIDAAEYLRATVVTVHANRRANYPVTDYWEDMVSTFRLLGDYAVQRGVQLGLETGFPDKVEEFVDLLEAVNHHGVGATLDTGHLARYVDHDLWRTPAGAVQLNDRLMDITRQLGIQIVHCHLHDVGLADWRDHHAVGRGLIDFQPFLAELQSVGYEGMLELELEEADQVTSLEESKGELESMLFRLDRVQRFSRRRAA